MERIDASQRRDPLEDLDEIDRSLAVEMQSEPRMREQTVGEVGLEQGQDSIIKKANSIDFGQQNRVIL